MILFSSHLQAYNGHMEALQVLMRSIVNLDIQDANGRTALDLAAFKGHAECVESLIMQGATIIVHDSVSKRTPLHASGNLDLNFRIGPFHLRSIHPLWKILQKCIIERCESACAPTLYVICRLGSQRK